MPKCSSTLVWVAWPLLTISCMRPTVLIVDDEAPLLRAMQRVLGKEFEVRTAPCVADALAAYGEHVVAVLTDFSMPDANGLSLAHQLRARGFKGPVAILSAVVETEELQQAISTGIVTELISKPWKSAELLERVRVLCMTGAPVPT